MQSMSWNVSAWYWLIDGNEWTCVIADSTCPQGSNERGPSWGGSESSLRTCQQCKQSGRWVVGSPSKQQYMMIKQYLDLFILTKFCIHEIKALSYHIISYHSIIILGNRESSGEIHWCPKRKEVRRWTWGRCWPPCCWSRTWRRGRCTALSSQYQHRGCGCQDNPRRISWVNS